MLSFLLKEPSILSRIAVSTKLALRLSNTMINIFLIYSASTSDEGGLPVWYKTNHQESPPLSNEIVWGWIEAVSLLVSHSPFLPLAIFGIFEIFITMARTGD